MISSPESLNHGAEDVNIFSTKNIMIDMPSFDNDTNIYNNNRKIQNEDMMAGFLTSSNDSSKINNIVMERVISFKQLAALYCNKSLILDLNIYLDKMVKFISEDQLFRGYKSDAIADSILLTVGSFLGIRKNVFLKCLSSEKKYNLSRIHEIKKFSCYDKIKNSFAEIREN